MADFTSHKPNLSLWLWLLLHTLKLWSLDYADPVVHLPERSGICRSTQVEQCSWYSPSCGQGLFQNWPAGLFLGLRQSACQPWAVACTLLFHVFWTPVCVLFLYFFYFSEKGLKNTALNLWGQGWGVESKHTIGLKLEMFFLSSAEWQSEKQFCHGLWCCCVMFNQGRLSYSPWDSESLVRYHLKDWFSVTMNPLK